MNNYQKMKIILVSILVLCTIFGGIGQAFDEVEELPSEVVKAKVLRILDEPVDTQLYESYIADVQTVEVRVTQGDFKGEVLTLDHVLSGNMAYDFYLDEGDSVLLWIETEEGELVNAYISELVRDHYLLYLTIFFILSLIVVGGIQGFKTVVTLGITGFFIIKVLLPLILKGYSPILVTVFVASIVVTLTVLIVSGFNRKTFSAIVGTIGGVLISGVVSLIMSSTAKLTGLSNEEAQMLLYIPQQIEFNFPGLLFAGMIIGAMGAVLDVGMSIASAMDEVKRANPDLSRNQLIQAGINVGKDIMGTMSNTLILAYTGASMPLLLVFLAYETPLSRIVNLDLIATEIIRALAGSIGLIFAIPITAVVAGLLYSSKKSA